MSNRFHLIIGINYKEVMRLILYFSGTGNSEYVAKRIGKATGDQVIDLFDKIRNQDFSELSSIHPWVVVTPTYAWRIPHILNNWLKNTKLSGNKCIYFVLTCGKCIGNADRYLKKLCMIKEMECKGTAEIVMPENYIAMFSTPSTEEALEIIKKSDFMIDEVIALIKKQYPLIQSDITFKDNISSGIVNTLFYPVFVHAKKFYATDKCINCQKCAKVCPLNNIYFENKKPVWGKQCTHCMACICHCPTEAIEYGKHSKGLARYTFPNKI